MLKLVWITTLLAVTSLVARDSSGNASGCLGEGLWIGNMVVGDHVEAIQLDLFVRRGGEYFTVGDKSFPLRAGVYGEVKFADDQTAFSIENAILKCNELTFDVHTAASVLVKFRAGVTHGGGAAQGEAAFPDRIAHVDWWQWPCGGGVLMLVRKGDPTYTDEARKARVEGEVVLLVQIDPSGRAFAARVVKGLGLGLDENAIEAVKHWEFRIIGPPPPVCEARLGVQFRLP